MKIYCTIIIFRWSVIKLWNNFFPKPSHKEWLPNINKLNLAPYECPALYTAPWLTTLRFYTKEHKNHYLLLLVIIWLLALSGLSIYFCLSFSVSISSHCVLHSLTLLICLIRKRYAYRFLSHKTAFALKTVLNSCSKIKVFLIAPLLHHNLL